MNEESLSALLDGECSPAELDALLERLSRDPALRERLSRMARALELRRGSRPPEVPADFADKVLAALPERPDAVAATTGVARARSAPGVPDEILSALLDGECTPGEVDFVLQAMNEDAGLRQRFARMALNQELRRGIRVPAIPADFADKVLAALPERPDALPAGPTVVPMPRRVSWQPLAGLAAAAAVGAVAVLAMKPSPAPTPPAVAVAQLPQQEAEPAEVPLDDAQARQLRNYVMAYSQSRAQQGLGGTLGYARYAAYTPADSEGSR